MFIRGRERLWVIYLELEGSYRFGYPNDFGWNCRAGNAAMPRVGPMIQCLFCSYFFYWVGLSNHGQFMQICGRRKKHCEFMVAGRARGSHAGCAGGGGGCGVKVKGGGCI